MRDPNYEKNSLSLVATIALGTSVMIGAGIFALTGQVAELAGTAFPLAFLVAAVVSGFSAYSYVKVTHRYPSAGGIAMILEKAYGKSTVTGAAALMMALSMIINESLVARTFGTYAVQLFERGTPPGWLVSLLAFGLIVTVFLVNIAGNKAVGAVANVSSALKILGLLLFAGIALGIAGLEIGPSMLPGGGEAETGFGRFIGGVALAILAYKGFTTITNSGDEVVDPEKNVGRAIVISLVICLVVYMLVTLAVGSNLSIDETVAARDYSLAEAARPAIGDAGVYLTVGIAVIATASGLLASTFAVSRMLAMLTDMRLIPHSHFGMPGDIQKHTLVYTVVLAALLAVLFDLSRIASMGAILYLTMDIVIHWGVLRRLRQEVDALPSIVVVAIVLDAVALIAFGTVKWQSDPLIVLVSIAAIVLLFLFERFYLRGRRGDERNTGGDHA